ncbi:hypothetical protein FNF27_00277 [Cafeteria roenbergensis]|uniref:Protein transport protein Sec61 subunit beta n=1 Tax=Cafeteria roenbergensis TaxID=33653 RepID=A0A5A8CS82_CAFRO|nr:hypothetical protein FNF29_01411 [Cafeteria roenbergensis]KAA0163613.1 hypothetical protein FNF31_02774 [Cafeteria roenbergensis]KAA0171799.1 hypothetical protein FNF28_00435 [Cafeteria roenbergensis]KAA0178428.1 hypothetical protein FNF27_00277 [Cafeteria roenbergensis]|eukprot:KAA0155992.1 hypothetical protein FNF29_01411 [Cafeteria roenbergensis]
MAAAIARNEPGGSNSHASTRSPGPEQMPPKSLQQRKQRSQARRSAARDDTDTGAEDEQRNMVGMRMAHVEGESESLLAFDPLTALIVATVFIASVIVLHIVSKFAR